jgi:hypothetical protein
MNKIIALPGQKTIQKQEVCRKQVILINFYFRTQIQKNSAECSKVYITFNESIFNFLNAFDSFGISFVGYMSNAEIGISASSLAS